MIIFVINHLYFPYSALTRPLPEWRPLCGQSGEFLLWLPRGFWRWSLWDWCEWMRQRALQEWRRLPWLREQLRVQVPTGLQWNPVWIQHSWMHREVSQLMNFLSIQKGCYDREDIFCCYSFTDIKFTLNSYLRKHDFPVIFLSSSCLNNGTCIDDINTFSCRCRHGFYGTFCEFEHNECDSQPCKNGGTCTDGLGTYRCTCPVGYSGQNCQVKCFVWKWGAAKTLASVLRITKKMNVLLNLRYYSEG